MKDRRIIMPKKKTARAEYDDDDFDSSEEPDTLVSKPPSASPRPRSAARKSVKKSTNNRRPGSTATRPRASSAPGTRTGKDLWMAAVKNRTGPTMVNGRTDSPRHKTPVEYWMDTLRKTGVGMSSESPGISTMTGLKKGADKRLAYLSTPPYLRQVMGLERPRKDPPDATLRASAGTPLYKSPEEYYEEIMQLKKQIVGLNQEMAAQKAKMRRIEEDNIKKEKEIGQLLDPGKSEDIRRTLTDGKADSGTVIHSLKQKILKLETQLRDRESAYAKLQSDLKTTKIDEMRLQMDVFMQEIVRLQNCTETRTNKSSRASSSKDNNVKTKALNETILRLSEANQRVQQENQGLREDLQKAMEQQDTMLTEGKQSKDYEDMNRKQLLALIARQNKKLANIERHRRDPDSISLASVENKPVESLDKLVLEGSLEDRLDQLDRRETELLQEIEKLRSQIHRLKEDKGFYRRSAQDKEKDIKQLLKEPVYKAETPRDRDRTPLTSPRKSITPRPRSPASSVRSGGSARQRRRESHHGIPDSPRSARLSDNERTEQNEHSHQQQTAATSIQRQWRNRKKKLTEQEETRIRDEKLKAIRENCAAKSIQKGWMGLQYRRHEEDVDNATSSIQAALRGHQQRQRQFRKRWDLDEDDDASDENLITDDEYNKAVVSVQSSLVGHSARKKRLRNIRFDSTDDDEDDLGGRLSTSEVVLRRPPSAKSRSSISSRSIDTPSGSKRGFKVQRPQLSDTLSEDDDDIVIG